MLVLACCVVKESLSVEGRDQGSLYTPACPFWGPQGERSTAPDSSPVYSERYMRTERADGAGGYG